MGSWPRFQGSERQLGMSSSTATFEALRSFRKPPPLFTDVPLDKTTRGAVPILPPVPRPMLMAGHPRRKRDLNELPQGFVKSGCRGRRTPHQSQIPGKHSIRAIYSTNQESHLQLPFKTRGKKPRPPHGLVDLARAPLVSGYRI
jgi:hypothetical protein